MPQDDPELAALADVGRDVLMAFPVVPGACMMMSALYARGLRDRGHEDAQLVAGSLTIEGISVFGARGLKGTPLRTNLDWDGHAWVTLGGFIADVSILRTGRSPKAPPRLRRFVEAQFSPTQGLYIASPEAAREDRLGYQMEWICEADEIEAIYRGALTYLKP